MREAISSFNRTRPDRELILKIGVHKGRGDRRHPK